MAAAVGACAHYFSAAVLYARKLDPAGLRVEVEAEKVRDPSPRFGKFSIRVKLPGGVPELYVPLIERAVRGCPAYGTLVHPPEVEISISKDVAESEAPAASAIANG
jgi:uncharacterized OsmC-like protein